MNRTNLGLALPALALLLVVAGGYRFLSRVPTPRETSDWKTCRSANLGFEVRYPSAWSIYYPSSAQGAAERDAMRLSSCEDAVDKIALGPGSEERPTGIYISVCDPDCLDTTIYKGARTLDDYLSMLSEPYAVTLDRVDGEEVALLPRQPAMVVFHKGVQYTIILFKHTDAETRKRLLKSMRFLR